MSKLSFEEFKTKLDKISYTESLSKGKKYTGIHVSGNHVIGNRESGNPFSIDIDELYTAYTKGLSRPTDLKGVISGRQCSPAAALLNAIDR